MVDTNAPTTLNGAWLTQNINTNATPGVQLSEAKAALQATNEAINEFLANFNNVPDGVDPTIDTEQLAKLLIEASLTQPIHINTPGGLVAVLDGSVIPDIDPLEAPSEDTSSSSLVAPEIGKESEPPAPSDEPAAKGALATIKDVSKAFRKGTPEEIRQKATEGTLTVKEAKMWATTTSKEGRALLGISGRMDAADREILIKQHLSRKAGAKADAPTGEDATSDTPKKGFFRKAADAATWPFRKAWAGIKKGWNWVTGKKAPVSQETAKAAPPVTGTTETEAAAPELAQRPAEPPTITETPLEAPPTDIQAKKEHTITGGESLWKIARQNLIENGIATPSDTQISKRARQIQDANPGIDPKKLQIGAKINMPSYDPAELERSAGLIPENSSATSPSKESSDDSEEIAKKELQNLGYLDDKGKITSEGKKVADRKDLLEFLKNGEVSDADSAYTELRTALLMADLEEVAATPADK